MIGTALGIIELMRKLVKFQMGIVTMSIQNNWSNISIRIFLLSFEVLSILPLIPILVKEAREKRRLSSDNSSID